MSELPKSLYAIEARGYGSGTGSILLPNGTQIQVSDTQAELNNVLLREAYECWEAHLVG